MSMVGRLREVSDADIDAYLANPSRFYRDFSEERFAVPFEFPDEAPQMLKDAAARLGALPLQKAMLRTLQSAQRKLNRKLAIGRLTPEAFLEAAKKLQEEARESVARYLQDADDVIAQTRRRTGFEEATAAYAKRATEAASDNADAGGELNLEKSWHCLHFVIAGHAERIDSSATTRSILGGDEIPDRAGAMGYGPVRYFRNADVRDISRALDQFPFENRVSAFDAKAAESSGIYSPRHSHQELRHWYARLSAFYRHAAAGGSAVLLWLE